MTSSPQYMKGAEPLFLKGKTTTGCLLLHGAGGGTAWDLKEFAHYLHLELQITVWLPTLQGFGTKPEDLVTVTFHDWFQQAEAGIVKLQQTCSEVVCLGHSFGGLLALILASKNPNIERLVTWAAAVSIKNRLLQLFPLISKIPFLNSLIPEKAPLSTSEGLKTQGWVGYDWLPSSIALIILEGLKTLKISLPEVQCDTLIIQGTHDEMVSNKSAYQIFQRIHSVNKEIWMIDGAHHPLFLEPEYKQELFERSAQFLAG